MLGGGVSVTGTPLSFYVCRDARKNARRRRTPCVSTVVDGGAFMKDITSFRAFAIVVDQNLYLTFVTF
jgi:hypothetical protein